jgi:hypothetical protein
MLFTECGRRSPSEIMSGEEHVGRELSIHLTMPTDVVPITMELRAKQFHAGSSRPAGKHPGSRAILKPQQVPEPGKIKRLVTRKELTTRMGEMVTRKESIYALIADDTKLDLLG